MCELRTALHKDQNRLTTGRVDGGVECGPILKTLIALTGSSLGEDFGRSTTVRRLLSPSTGLDHVWSMKRSQAARRFALHTGTAPHFNQSRAARRFASNIQAPDCNAEGVGLLHSSPIRHLGNTQLSFHHGENKNECEPTLNRER